MLAENVVVRPNVPYGQDPLQQLDVYSPLGVTGAPIVLFVHGGEWTRHDKAEVSYKPKFFNENNIVFASTNYRLSPAATHPAHAGDVASAIGWLHKHAGEIGGDPKKIVIMGHSAGCHLVTLVGFDPRYLAGVGLRPSDLAGVVAWSGGAYDLVQKVKDGGSYAGYIQQAFGPSEEAWRKASPVAHLDGVKQGPPFLFASVEPGKPSQLAAERLATLIREAGGTATTKILPDRDHFGANHFLGARTTRPAQFPRVRPRSGQIGTRQTLQSPTRLTRRLRRDWGADAVVGPIAPPLTPPASAARLEKCDPRPVDGPGSSAG